MYWYEIYTGFPVSISWFKSSVNKKNVFTSRLFYLNKNKKKKGINSYVCFLKFLAISFVSLFGRYVNSSIIISNLGVIDSGRG